MEALQTSENITFTFSNEEITTLFKELLVYAPYQDTNCLGDNFLDILKKMVMVTKMENTEHNEKC